jgi:hypothetical protein
VASRSKVSSAARFRSQVNALALNGRPTRRATAGARLVTRAAGCLRGSLVPGAGHAAVLARCDPAMDGRPPLRLGVGRGRWRGLCVVDEAVGCRTRISPFPSGVRELRRAPRSHDGAGRAAAISHAHEMEPNGPNDSPGAAGFRLRDDEDAQKLGHSDGQEPRLSNRMIRISKARRKSIVKGRGGLAEIDAMFLEVFRAPCLDPTRTALKQCTPQFGRPDRAPEVHHSVHSNTRRPTAARKPGSTPTLLQTRFIARVTSSEAWRETCSNRAALITVHRERPLRRASRMILSISSSGIETVTLIRIDGARCERQVGRLILNC